jgi:hypothetical protein
MKDSPEHRLLKGLICALMLKILRLKYTERWEYKTNVNCQYPMPDTPIPNLKSPTLGVLFKGKCDVMSTKTK